MKAGDGFGAVPHTVDVIVVGGGVVGVATAWHLARLGAGRVLLLERDGLASGATGRSTAIVRTHYVHRVLAEMALEARRAFERFGEEVGGDCGFRRTGFLVLSGPEDRVHLEANVAMHRAVGIDARVLTPEDLHVLEPRISIEGVGAAAWEPDSGKADPHGTTAGYAAAARGAGVEIRTGTQVGRILTEGSMVTGVETGDGTIWAGSVLVAAGLDTAALVAPLGFETPLTGIRHGVAGVRRSQSFGAAHATISDRVLGGYYMPEGSELTLIGSTAASDGEPETDARRQSAPSGPELESLAARFLGRFPGEQHAALQSGWTGVYDCSPDLQPLLGPVPGIERLHLACGFSGHGFKLSPVLGRLLAERMVLGRERGHSLDLFSPARFQQGRPITAAHAYTVQTLG